MKFKAVYLGHSRFVVNKSEKKKLRKIAQKYWYFSYFSMKTYVVGTHKKRLMETLPLITHNICFHGEIRKILSGYPSYWSVAMNKYLEQS